MEILLIIFFFGKKLIMWKLAIIFSVLASSAKSHQWSNSLEQWSFLCFERIEKWVFN